MDINSLLRDLTQTSGSGLGSLISFDPSAETVDQLGKFRSDTSKTALTVALIGRPNGCFLADPNDGLSFHLSQTKSETPVSVARQWVQTDVKLKGFGAVSRFAKNSVGEQDIQIFLLLPGSTVAGQRAAWAQETHDKEAAKVARAKARKAAKAATETQGDN